MAQAARLSLRMQKELKLLLTDPPPGAAFPFLSPDSDLCTFSLSTIHAQIQGPEGTVYEKGTFKINIQVPERYPFQPPIVTFATPIYHPNIDNGGRICLDILNLPPKGAWQPSLNISTVLTSIGLLLSEPNPDDGLMCEASKEYKYNRQAFDHKARSLTEKYARCGGRENGSCNPNFQAHPNTSTVEAKESDSTQRDFNEYFVNYKKQLGVSRKLSLDSSGSNPRDSDKEVKEASSPHISDNHLGVEGPKQCSKDTLNECHQDHDKSLGTTRSLAVGSSGQTNTRGDEGENMVPYQTHHKDQDFKPKISISKKLCIGQKRPLEPLNPGQRSGDCQKNLITMPQMLPHETDYKVVERKLLEPKAISTIEIESQKDYVDRLVNDFTNPRRKKLGLAGKKSSSGFSTFPRKEDKDNKENIAPNTSTVLLHSNVPFTAFSMSPKTSQTGHQYEEKSEKKDVNAAAKKLPLLPLGQLEGSNECHMKPQEDHGERLVIGIKDNRDDSLKPETVIVLDSEDSEEEREGTLRSKLSIVRKRLPGKWNAKR